MSEYIEIKDAHQHNLKHINVKIPRNKLVVLTGVSGSGKSSLVFDTLYAEAQRRYVESLSAFLRQELKQMEKPKVGYISGLPPAISIKQRRIFSNPRATVGTVTEIVDYLRILYSIIGQSYCHNCAAPFIPTTLEMITKQILEKFRGTKGTILTPVVRDRKGSHKYTLNRLRQEDHRQARIDGKYLDLEKIMELDSSKAHSIEVIDHEFDLPHEITPDTLRQLNSFVENALEKGRGTLLVDAADEINSYSTLKTCPRCGTTIPELSVQLFNWNSPEGMCESCNGLGTLLKVDPAKIILDPNLSIMKGALRYFEPARLKKLRWEAQQLQSIANHYEIDLNTPWNELPEGFRDVILYGSGDDTYEFKYTNASSSYTFLRDYVYEGIIPTINRRFNNTNSEYRRQVYKAYMTQQPCPSCNGARLRPEGLSVKIRGKNLAEICEMSVGELRNWLKALKDEVTTDAKLQTAAEQIISEISNRLRFLMNVGLHYLNLNRRANTLSAGEGQRIRLATQIGSGLVGVLYILDEPTIGLHPHDISSLLENLKNLREIGNTVVVVEHDPTVIKNADHIIDIGPGAGIHGGKIVAQGTPHEIMVNTDSLTGSYLTGSLKVSTDNKRHWNQPKKWLTMTGARLHNLKNVTLRVPLGSLSCVTGVSGSGKSSLITQTLYPAIAWRKHGFTGNIGPHDSIEGLEQLDKVVVVDQSPIGRTPRSCLATYIKVFDEIRKVFARTEMAKERGYSAGMFSFNKPGGRCDECKGYGSKRINMHFLADIWVPCPKCSGTRYKKEILEVTYRERNIHDVMEMDVNEALRFFNDYLGISRMLETLKAVGLDYMELGQTAPTFSGGEAQRAKLARELTKSERGRNLYILDEPTTGLHFHDIQKLIDVLDLLVNAGNTVILIEHNLDVIKNVDWVIDLGPEGGEKGGEVIGEGTPREIMEIPTSKTGYCLKQAL